ncbi:MAG: FkbM family methyltransferase [Alphaproteobacteria bacterium]|nr:FkbM family methyltransferase [Alphaproteobacteria bacterium]
MMEFPPDLFAGTPLSQAMRNYPCTAIDVGSAGGIIADLNPIAFAVDAIGFEPNPDHFADLSAADSHWRSLRYLPHAIGGQSGTRTLYRPRFGNSSTMLPPNTAIGDAFDKLQFFDVEETTQVDVIRLDDALDQFDIRNPDYLKLDVEGAEFEILEGAAQSLSTLSAIRVEVCFIEVRQGQRLGMEVGHYLERLGFRLMHMTELNPWRVHGYRAHPAVSREPIRYSRGQLVHADFLFMRDPEFFADAERRIRGAFLAMTHGFFDHAERLLSDPETNALLQAGGRPVNLPDALDAASRRMASHLWRARVLTMPRRAVSLTRDALGLMKPRRKIMDP